MEQKVRSRSHAKPCGAKKTLTALFAEYRVPAGLAGKGVHRPRWLAAVVAWDLPTHPCPNSQALQRSFWRRTGALST